jgi:hypothetical protein
VSVRGSPAWRQSKSADKNSDDGNNSDNDKNGDNGNNSENCDSGINGDEGESGLASK